MRRPSRTGLAAAAALALAGGPLAACGSSGDPIPASRAADLKAELDTVKAEVASGNCDAAGRAVAQVKGSVLNLPSSVDGDLRDRLQEGVDNLEQRVPAACGSAGAQQSTPSTTTQKQQTQTQKTDTESTDTAPKETTPTETQPTQTTPTQTQTQPTTPTQSTPAPDTGGASPDSGATP